MTTNLEGGDPQQVYNGKCIFFMGPNHEDWWVVNATMECKPSGFSRRGGGGSNEDTWQTGYQYMHITTELAHLTAVDLEQLLGLPLDDGSAQADYQDDTIPASPGPYTITLDEDAKDVDYITVFGHEGAVWSKFKKDTAAGESGEYSVVLGPPTVLTFHSTDAGKKVRIRYIFDSTNGYSADFDPEWYMGSIKGCFYTSEWVDNQTGWHGQLWEIPAMIMHPDSVLRFGGDAQGAEGVTSSIVFNAQGTSPVTWNRY